MLLLGNIHANPNLSPETTIKNLHAYVNFLTADALTGRLTGTPGEKGAAQYIATIFRKLGLKPAGDKGTFFQEFNFTAGVTLGKNNALALSNQKGIIQQLKLNEDWRPLSFSDSATFKISELIFAGFGITAHATGYLPAYDSYHGLNVKNKWVIVFANDPENLSAARRKQINQYTSLRYKAFTAKQHGAKGIIFISKQQLVPFVFDTSLTGSGIIALSIKQSVLDELFNNRVHTLQNAASFEQKSALPSLMGFKLTGQTDVRKETKRGWNVLAKFISGSNHARMIMVGAHFDHLGRGRLNGSRTRSDEVGQIHSGADDNASGVATILEVASRLSALKAQGKWQGKKDVLFAAWSGEELGILGSSHFVTTFLQHAANHSLRPSIEVAINLDMVGHLREKLVLQGMGSSRDWLKLIHSIEMKSTLPLTTQRDPYLPTDATAFYLHGVPILNFFTGAHDDYHTPRDKAATLNYVGMESISDYLVNLIQALENQSTLMDYQAAPKTYEYAEREFKIYLGTIPDYVSADVLGVKLSGVAKNSPAEQAGIQQGDVIIELAGKSIHDIYDYTFALNALPVGKPVKIVVRRQQKQMTLIIVARYRN